ncbi:MAG: bifunctional nuclease family protein [Chloroflexi bacterium]|nr:bifunctional nuclease family protein [Chloroflexota bacterium]
MIALSVEGLRWCEHAGWLLVLCDPRGARRLQITLSLPDAVTLGHELAGRCTERTGLYGLIGALVRERCRPASVQFALGDAQRAKVTLVVEDDDRRQAFPVSTADGVALAVRASIPLFADEALMEAFAVSVEPHRAAERETAPGQAEIPAAFRLALGEPN